MPRHPSQLYEAAIGLLVLGVLLGVDRLAGGERRPRWLLAGTFFGVAYFSLRVGVEYLKAPQVFLDGGWDMGQWLSVPFIVGGGACLAHAGRRARRSRSSLVASAL